MWFHKKRDTDVGPKAVTGGMCVDTTGNILGGGVTGVVRSYHGREDGIAKGYLCPDEECPLCVQGMGGAHPTDDQGRMLHYHQFAASQGIREAKQ